MLQQFILLGLISGSVNQPTCPPADPTVGQSDTAFVYMTATADLPNGQFTIVTPQTCLLRINWLDRWGRSWPDKIGSAYPSLLDPMSPILSGGASIDRN